jgi:hypothetical protein
VTELEQDVQEVLLTAVIKFTCIIKETIMSQATETTNHDTIRQWAEQRGGRPATVKATANDDPGILRIDFPGYSGEETLEEISWAEFFKAFDQNKLLFLYQDQTDDGETSRFCKFIDREEAGKK